MTLSAIQVEYLPAGVKFLRKNSEGNYPEVQKFIGTSFCEAVRCATEGTGKALLLEPDSIQVCRWSPVVLGFQHENPTFDLKVEYHLKPVLAGVLVAPITWFKDLPPPDVVIIRALPREISKVLAALNPTDSALPIADRIDVSALKMFMSNDKNAAALRILRVNRILDVLNRSEAWRTFTKMLFRRSWTTYLYNIVLRRYLANMSICRNTTVIPFLTEKVNVSFFCTGGITWGGNHPKNLVCGMPYDLYRRFTWHVSTE